MTILAIDTSGLSASVAVIRENKLLGEFFIDLKMTHSQTIMPMLDKLLVALELTCDDIDLIAASSGPGSFTGLRIGAAAAQGLAFALNKDIVPVPTLDALAYNVINASGLVVPIMDAKRGQVYSAVYSYNNNKFSRITDYLAEDLNEIFKTLHSVKKDSNVTRNESIVFTGDGVDAYKESILAKGFLVAPPHASRQRAATVAALAVQLASQGKTVNPDGFVPLYIRKPQAEQALEAK